MTEEQLAWENYSTSRRKRKEEEKATTLQGEYKLPAPLYKGTER